MKENLKTKRGITLIALIITIIILLILAMVTINILINQGIIGHANNAVRGYEVAEEKELIGLAYQNYKMDKLHDADAELVVDGANGGSPIPKEEGTWYITFDKTKHNYELSEDGTVDVAKERWKDNGDGTISKGELTVQIGDYIEYDCYTGASSDDLYYKSPSTANGYGDQEFQVTEADKTRKWKVLGRNSRGNILITTSDSILTKSNNGFFLQKKAGYVNGPDELDAISKIYGHGERATGARSITIEDVNAISGQHLNDTYIQYTYTKSAEDGKIRRNDYTGSSIPETYWYYENDNPKGEWKKLTIGETSPEIADTSYGYQIGTSNAALKMLSKKDDGLTNANYWLASRCVHCDNDYVSFEVRKVGNDSIGGHDPYLSNDNFHLSAFYVRPVVTLASDVELEYDSINQTWKIK